jgi:Leucine-rich repeat (LRR) protein
MNSDRLLRIKDKLEQLIKKDSQFQIFGSNHEWNGHRYQLHEPLAEADLAAFEAQHQLQLPDEYRAFLNQLANGGAGPFYGLYSLADGISEAEQYSTEENEPVKNPFAQDFPLSNDDVKKFISYYDRQIEEGEDDNIQYPDVPDPLTGVIFLSQYGCGWSYCLVVKGEQAGSVWYHGESLSPCFSQGRQWTFFDWYEDWLDRSLKELEPVPAEESPKFDPNQTIINYDGWNLDEIPAEVFSCQKLKKLVFSRNGLKEFPARVTGFKELRTLDLSMTPMVEIPDQIGRLKNLRRLFLNYNYHLDLPAGLAGLQNLEELSMYYNYKIKSIPEVVTELSNLKTLKFSYCSVLKKIPSGIGKLKKLELLDLQDCGKLTKLPDELTELDSLKHLYLDHTKIKKLPKGFENLKNLESLGLNIAGLDWTDAIEKIKNLPRLKWLRISMQLDYPPALRELKIKQLNIAQNYDLWHQGHQRCPVPESICLIPELEELDLVNNNQANALPENIGRLKSLKKLEVSSTAIKTFPESLKELTQLEQISGNLDQSGNSDFGILPAEKEKVQAWFPQAKIWIW